MKHAMQSPLVNAEQRLERTVRRSRKVCEATTEVSGRSFGDARLRKSGAKTLTSLEGEHSLHCLLSNIHPTPVICKRNKTGSRNIGERRTRRRAGQNVSWMTASDQKTQCQERRVDV